MDKRQQANELLKIVSYAEQHNQETFDFKKSDYLLMRFERTVSGGVSDDTHLAALIGRLCEIAESSGIVLKIYFYSFLARVTFEAVYLEKLLEAGYNELQDPLTLNYIRWRCISLCFRNPSMGSSGKCSRLMTLIYKRCYDSFCERFGHRMRFIPKAARNKKLALVFTSQILSLNHGPTKTLLARCATLKRELGMDVMIINTREFLSDVGETHFYKAACGNVDESFNDINALNFEGLVFGFYQSPVPMPDYDELERIFKLVEKAKPYYIVSIGGNSLACDLCAKIVPVLTIGTVPSSIPGTWTQFRTIGRKLSDNDIRFLEEYGIDKQGVIESIFTSNFRKQTDKLTRKGLNLPENKLLAMIVGSRLNDEVDRDFLNMLAKTSGCGVHYVFAGPSDKIQKLTAGDPALSSHCTFLGTMPDMLAVAEVCDIYVNPKRTGGGTSCVEAMIKGVPVVTLPSGDVGLNAGEDFFAADYDEMAEIIKRYTRDRNFLELMSKKAVSRAEPLTDTDKEFKKIIDSMVNSGLFK